MIFYDYLLIQRDHNDDVLWDYEIDSFLFIYHNDQNCISMFDRALPLIFWEIMDTRSELDGDNDGSNLRQSI